MLAQELSEAGDTGRRDAARNMFEIVIAQRNRLRVRVEELEKASIDEKAQSASLQSELEKARQDNVQLYGKIKFLQSLPYRPPVSQSSGFLFCLLFVFFCFIAFPFFYLNLLTYSFT